VYSNIDRLPDSKHFGVLNCFDFDEEYYDLEYDIEDEMYNLQDNYYSNHGTAKEVKLSRFRKEAERRVKAEHAKDDAHELKTALKQIAKCKYKVLIAVTNHAQQRKSEDRLKKLGFRVKLRFTNPNHNREDTLNLWIKRLK